MRNQDIADQLVISLSIVKRHIANARGKLGVDDRADAVARLNDLSPATPSKYTPELHPLAD